uniref:GRF-type domain-containing protein n=1 Tax=Triticum urartu TaxID=4572 RepID=A0A8R7QXY0_TRIUA
MSLLTMSSGSHCSSASSRFRSGGTSPIPYRVHPMDYEPSVNCYCSRKASLLTSWTDANPGRRYLCCSRAMRCGFWRWFDPRASPTLGSHSLICEARSFAWTARMQCCTCLWSKPCAKQGADRASACGSLRF